MFASRVSTLVQRMSLPLGAALVGGAAAVHLSSSSVAAEAGAPPIQPGSLTSAKLLEVSSVSHDTKKFVFGVPNGADSLGLPVASCIMVQGDLTDDKGNQVARPYTPVRDEAGEFDLVVKVYPDGKLSKYLGELKPGDEIKVKGPFTKFTYKPSVWSRVGMVAGGSGITPMLQVLEHALAIEEDTTKFSLIFANKTTQDILLKEQIDALAAKHGDRLQVHYGVGQVAEGEEWSGFTGFVNKDLLEQLLPPPTDADAKVFVCGPPGMMKAVSGDKVSPREQGEVSGLLKELGYTKDSVFKF